MVDNAFVFQAKSFEEKEGWINAITKEMKRLKGEQKSSENKIEIKQKKKVIHDKFNLPDVGKDRSYMKTRTESLMKNETFFLPVDPKEKKSKKKKESNNIINTSSNVPKYSNSNTNASSSSSQNVSNSQQQIQQFNVQENQQEESAGVFSCCYKLFSCFKSGSGQENKEQLNP